ncbi:MAG TPA: signal peptide peptidase SppA [Desulfobaccales bacterium]|nr:signal peptide peptidase SppA [Desulfobaccales bacterium]
MRRLTVAGLVLMLVWLLLTTGCLTVNVSLFEERKPLKEKTISGYRPEKILLMEVSGVILEGKHGLLGWLKGVTSPSRIKEELDKAAKDSCIKAVVVRINSPGGSVTAADVIYHELKAFKADQGVPIVVCLQGLAASGGYYVAQAGDTIVAYPTCITGSIGVIAMKFNLQGLMNKVGVGEDVVKSGKWKDFWSPFRPATPAEKQMMKHVIDNFYHRFVDIVAGGRNLSLKKTLALADGRIFTADEALNLGLVDQLGYLEDAIKLARTEADLAPGARVVIYHRPGSYKPTIYSLMPELDMAGPQFLYLWWAGAP